MLNPHLIHELDQVTAFSEEFARMQRVYHQALLDADIPEDLAHDLTLQYGNLFWHFILSHVAQEA